MGQGKGRATLSARLRAAVYRAIRENPLVRVFRKSPEVSLASTLSTQTVTQVSRTGEIVPPLSEIEKKIDRDLRLWNWPWPRSTAVRGISLVLRKWALEDGLEAAARRGALILEREPLKWAGAAPLIGLVPMEKLTPKKFADLLEGLIDDIEGTNRMRPDEDNRGSDQRLLPGDRTPSEGCGAGCQCRPSGGDGVDGQEGVQQPGEGGRVLDFPSERRGSDGVREGLSRREVVEEIEENLKDIRAFSEAYSVIHRRVQEVKDEGRMLQLVGWSGTAAVMGTLELSIHAMERAVDELRDILRRIDRGVIPNQDDYDG